MLLNRYLKSIKGGKCMFRLQKEERNKYSMIFNIMVGVLGFLAIVAGVFAWKLENGSFGEKEDTDGTLENVTNQGKDEEN